MDDYKFDFEKYSKISSDYFEKLLKEKGDDERAFQDFFERNVSFIPGAHSPFGQNMSGHKPLHSCLISQPKIRGLNTRIPDFMWLSLDSAVFSPVLVEIEAPNKKYFNKNGTPNSNFTKAKNQLDEWCSHLSKAENQLNFYEDFDIDTDSRRLVFEPFYLLIYGRRKEYQGNELLIRKRRRLIDKSSQQVLMSFDRIGPHEINSEFSCCYVKERKFKLIALGQATKLNWPSDHLIKYGNLVNGIEEMMFTPWSRKKFLKENIENHIKELKKNNGR